MKVTESGRSIPHSFPSARHGRSGRTGAQCQPGLFLQPDGEGLPVRCMELLLLRPHLPCLAMQMATLGPCQPQWAQSEPCVVHSGGFQALGPLGILFRSLSVPRCPGLLLHWSRGHRQTPLHPLISSHKVQCQCLGREGSARHMAVPSPHGRRPQSHNRGAMQKPEERGHTVPNIRPTGTGDT